ncbi:MAG TPA: YigZ family protein [Firmicutes bacterium]|nr:YigZ family protein [Candidatus Fermentithermobacillaceae bacterium]
MQNRPDFLCPRKEASAEIVVKRSRFIGHVAPAFSVEEAESFISKVKAEHPTARHNVWAYCVGPGTPVERLSDDGEPRGTAGYPVLEVFKKRGLRNAVCVVTRYFGGILLGAGGLLRAYGQAASAALEAAGVATYRYHDVLTAVVSYEQYGRIQRELEVRNITIQSVDFAEKVSVTALVRPSDLDMIKARIRDVTSGSATIEILEGRYVPIQ